MTDATRELNDAQIKRTIAKRAGFFVREGSYHGTTDDRLGRWYVGRQGEAFRPWGNGHRTQRDAWAAAYDLATTTITTYA